VPATGGAAVEGILVTWQRVVRGFALLWIGSSLGFGMPAASQAPEAELPADSADSPLPAAAPPSDSVSAFEPIDSAKPVPSLGLPGPTLDRLDRAWSSGPHDLRSRAERARAAADEMGVENADALARALVFGGRDLGSFEERAEAAALLAPDLPAAHAALARARLASGSPTSAAASAIDALAALPRSIDGWLWFGATGGVLLLVTLAGGAALYVGARGLASVSNAAHDLGDRLEPSMPEFSRVALVAGLILLPAAIGEGLAGALLGLLVVAWWHGTRAQRITLACSALLFVAAIHPVAQIAGARLAAIGADPLVDAALAADAGALDPVEAGRLARAASDRRSGAGSAHEDPLAMYALAQWARRSGDLAEADARLGDLLKRAPDDPVVLAGAASAKIALGAPKEAVELYRRAIAMEPTALLWFNLSQAHGRAIDVEQHARALAAAQSIDPDAVSELTARLSTSRGAYVADVPMPPQRLRDRLASSDASAVAARLRAPIAPGWLGRSIWLAALAFAAAAAVGAALARSFEASTTCRDCETRLCRSCGTAGEALRSGIGGQVRCASCRARRIELRATAGWDPRPIGARARRIRAAQALGALLPGLAGRSAHTPALGLIAAVCATGALAFAFGADAIVSDPARIGRAGSIAFGAVTALCVILYAGIAVLSIRLARRSRA
jgi:tetratricopeptide (TPR) repeat protein